MKHASLKLAQHRIIYSIYFGFFLPKFVLVQLKQKRIFHSHVNRHVLVSIVQFLQSNFFVQIGIHFGAMGLSIQDSIYSRRYRFWFCCYFINENGKNHFDLIEISKISFCLMRNAPKIGLKTSSFSFSRSLNQKRIKLVCMDRY